MQQVRFLFLAAVMLVVSPRVFGQGFQKISAHIFTRQTEKGYVSAVTGDLYYTRNGNLVTNFTSPRDYVMVTNTQGEVRIYDPKKNTVMQFQNSLFSTTTTSFFYFFTGKTTDMGLQHSGYKITTTRFDGDMMITEWKVETPQPKDPVVYVKLVHRKSRPIYIDYQDQKHHILRKVYYYDYTELGGVSFPKTFTEILYQKADSVITKTEYSNFKLNGEARSSFFNFKIPENAKLINQ
jgi:outer membrane lipoprotein-sorting protein